MQGAISIPLHASDLTRIMSFFGEFVLVNQDYVASSVSIDDLMEERKRNPK